MTEFPALMSLIVAARLAGVDPSALEQARPADGETIVDRVELSVIAAAQEAAFIERAEDGLAAAVVFDADGAPWIRLRQDGTKALLEMSDLAAGRTVVLPRGEYRVTLAGGLLRADSGPARAPLASFGELVDAAYAKGRQALFPPERYAVLIDEDLSALTLLRKDQNDVYRVTHASFARLSSRPVWFFALNWVGYAVRLDGREAVFFKKPLKEPAALSRETVLPPSP